MTRRVALVVALAFTVGAVAILLSSVDREPALESLAPELDAELRAHLEAGDRSAVDDWTRRAGWVGARTEMARLIAATIFAHDVDFELRREVALPAFVLLSESFTDVFHVPIARVEAAAYRHLEAVDLEHPSFAFQGWEQSIMSDASIDDEERVRRLREHVELCRRLGLHWRALGVDFHVAQSLSYLGRSDAARAMHERAAADAERRGAFDVAAQHLGTLGWHYGSGPDADEEAMWAAYDRALQLAHRTRQPVQTARILSFAASRRFSEGDVTLAHDLHQESIEWSATYRGLHHEPRFLNAAARFNARLGAWDTVAQLADRSEGRLRLHPHPVARQQAYYEGRMRQLRAYPMFVHGNVEAASDTWERGHAQLAEFRLVEQMAGGAADWARVLLDAGHHARAREIVQRGLATADAHNLTRKRIPLLALGAISAALEGDHATAESFLDALDEDELSPRERLLFRAARFAIAIDHQPDAVADTALDAIDALADLMVEIEPGPHGYLRLEFADVVRSLIDSALADARVRYEADMAWRALPRDMGDAIAMTAASSGVSRLRGLFLQDGAEIERTNAVLSGNDLHLVYRFEHDQVTRYVATASTVRADDLDVHPGALVEAVSDVVATMSTDPGERSAPLPRELEAALEALASRLLPEEVERGGRILLSLDGILERLPFASLDLRAGDGYQPLLETRAPLVVRHVTRGEAVEAGAAPLVVADPVPVPWLTRLYPGLRASIDSRREVEVLRDLWPGARFLQGSAATESAVTAAWGGASRLYFVSHVGNLPTARHCAFLPMSVASPSERGPAVHLDLGDILAADLEGCEMVVLSGCGSGAARMQGRRDAPSLADAFLDAGVHSALSTLWAIRDDDAGRFVSEVVRRADDGLPDLEVLLAVQREWSRRDDGEAAHPFSWAPYVIEASLRMEPLSGSEIARRP